MSRVTAGHRLLEELRNKGCSGVGRPPEEGNEHLIGQALKVLCPNCGRRSHEVATGYFFFIAWREKDGSIGRLSWECRDEKECDRTRHRKLTRAKMRLIDGGLST